MKTRPKHVTWTIQTGPFLHCRRCGCRQLLGPNVPVVRSIRILKAFNAAHRGCQERKS